MDATPLLRLYARHRLRQLQAQDPVATQEQQLLSLVKRAAYTRFGKDHRFGEIRTVAEYQERVPIRSYEDLWAEYWKPSFPHIADVTWPGPVRHFAETSGTSTGGTKYIPYPDAMNRSNMKAIIDVLVHHLGNQPKSRLLAGRNLVLFGETTLRSHGPGIYSGDLTAIGGRNIPWWARRWHFTPRELGMISDWEEKIERLARLPMQREIRTIAGYPAWLLFFIDKLAKARVNDARLIDLFPSLELLVYGGVQFGPYRKIFDQLLEGSKAAPREVYAASEGFIAIADRQCGEGLRLISDTGLFFEFVPVDELGSSRPTRHWIANVETGVEYALVLSTCAGAWSYVIGDTVRLVDLNPPRLLVTGRTTHTLSGFGEHLTVGEIDAAITNAAAAINVFVTDYSASAVYPERAGEPGSHRYVVEFLRPIAEYRQLEKFTDKLDTELCETNDDYRRYRRGDITIAAPSVVAVDPGSFATWMKNRGKMGGQNKVPRVITDPALAEDLQRHAQRSCIMRAVCT